MSVSILYYKVPLERISSAQQTEQIGDWIPAVLEELPAEKRLRINKLHHQKDKVLSLAGLQLLKHAMADFPTIPFSLSTLQFPDKAKPFIEGNIDFNISHSGDIACCVISDNHKVGIDVEQRREVKQAILDKYLTPTCSKQAAQSGKTPQSTFFNCWTQFEAIIKASNHGSIFNAKDIELNEEGGRYHQQFWYTYPVDIISNDENSSYTCHIACSEKISADDITIKQIFEL